MMWAVLSRQVRRRNELKQRKAQASALRRHAVKVMRQRTSPMAPVSPEAQKRRDDERERRARRRDGIVASWKRRSRSADRDVNRAVH